MIFSFLRNSLGFLTVNTLVKPEHTGQGPAPPLAPQRCFPLARGAQHPTPCAGASRPLFPEAPKHGENTRALGTKTKRDRRNPERCPRFPTPLRLRDVNCGCSRINQKKALNSLLLSCPFGTAFPGLPPPCPSVE